MSKFISFYTLFIINYILTSQKPCGGNEIDHCIDCKTEQGICTKCENKYFISFAGLKCISCNHEKYGQLGCDGNCDGSKYKEIKNVLCDKCKEGYYNIDGICTPCSFGSENCVKCSYEASSEINKKIYTCLECVGGLNGEYRVAKDGICRKCPLPPNCIECRYKNGTNDVECIKCEDNFYLSNGVCNGCFYQSNSIAGGICNNYYCPGGNHNKKDYCTCNSNYVLTAQNTCIPCPNNFCPCYYDQSTNLAKCRSCPRGYALSTQGTCISCASHCYSCYYDQSSNTVKCDNCNSGYVLSTKEGTCIPCTAHCSSCYYDLSSNSAKCNGCDSDYALSTKEGTCISCPSTCNTCYYDINTNSAKCSSCISKYVLNSNNECIYCGAGCNNCYLNNGNIWCTSCEESYTLENNKCIKLNVPPNCNNYISQRFNNTDDVICTSCEYKYALDKINNKCIICPSYCTYCHLDDSNRLICDNCDPDYVLNETKLCESCTSNEEIGGEGCIHCQYENGINKCFDCRYDYIHIDDDYACKLPSEINLNVGCNNATRLENGDYACNKCRKINNTNYTMMIRYNNTMDCYPSENELVYCEKGNEDENKNLSCTNCLYDFRFIWSEEYQKNICDDQCESDHFFNDNLDIMGCYKCDNESGGGQIGCYPKTGCSYVAADNHLYCNSCKNGYYLYDWQCLPCSTKDNNCIECDFNITEKKFKCNKCINNTFYVNNETGLCDIITYDEYPEVTAGCILPINNYTTYINNSKCFDCKYGFFKTKEESCIYCKARKIGGPKCDECQYKNGKYGSLNCKICQNDNMLSSTKRCYNCEDEVGPGCKKCGFENEDLICEECKEDYYLNNGHCIFKKSDENYELNCLVYEHSNSQRMLKAGLRCKKCNDGYYVNSTGRCESLSLEKCSLNSMFNFEKSIYDECTNFCEMNYYPIVDYKEYNENIKNILKNNLNISYDSLEKEIKDIIDNGKLCINNTDKNNKLRKCFKIEYNLNTKNYKCSKCIYGYQLDNSNNKCVQITEIENKNITNQECNNETILIKSGNYTFCEKPIGELEGCANGTIADTNYVNTIYNCYNCSDNYEPIFLTYFNRTMCIGIEFPTMENNKLLPNDSYKGIDKDNSTMNGTCSSTNLFTPDGKNCYLCSNDKVGMPGCRGSCTYSKDRNNIIECEEECNKGYLETSKGVCESCDMINKGCLYCNYTEDFPVGYPNFRRQRRFECKRCNEGEGYQLAKDGLCHHCTEFGFEYCDVCIKRNENKEIECFKCIEGYFLANNGYCTKCEAPKVQGTQKRCIFCNNTKEGGIKGCELCNSDNGNITCKQCEKGFILLENNKTCIEISKSENLGNFANCQKVSQDSAGKYECTKCFENYTLFLNNNGAKGICANNEFILTPKPETLTYCKKVVNMGKEDHPKHSCEKCIENDILTQEQREQGIAFIKITFPENETSYCDISTNYNTMENCSDARIIKDQKGNILFYNCTKCLNGANFTYKVDLNMTICPYFNYSKYCMVKNCKFCKYGNNYFCSQCLFDNYEVNPVTGSCIEKISKDPIISWKDSYRLTLNTKTQLNSQDLYGFSINLRGISGSQIPTGHAFLINLVFDIKYNRNLRNIEENDIETEEIKIPTYCQIVGHTDEVKNKVNLIDYYCFANRTGEDEIRENDIRLKKIEVSNEDNSEFIEFSNFEDMISKLNLDELKDKDTSSFTLRKFNDIIVFEMDEVVDQKSENYTFDFIIYGRINKKLEPDIIQTKFELRRIKNIFADCEFHIKENQTADLKCHVNLEEYKEKEIYKFRTIEFQYKDSSIYLNRFNEINLVHEEKEKKSNNLAIIIIVTAIILVIIITISIIFLIKKLSNSHKRSIKNKSKKPNPKTKKKPRMHSIKNGKDPYKLSTKISIDELSIITNTKK